MMNEEDMDDRRAKPRLSVNLDAVWDGTEGKHAARITDLSEGGCYMDTVGEVMSGEIVCFRVLLADGDWLYLEGEVKHHRHKLGFGVQFVDLNDEQLDKLRWLLKLAEEAGPQAPAIQAHLVEE
ncbi:MAG TPA: PilZ domain-containing protein [Pyrinomonadaceae bacterium]|nr:PilZ domain-containing protein [Pyrinomonadaceae bacterium]